MNPAAAAAPATGGAFFTGLPQLGLKERLHQWSTGMFDVLTQPRAKGLDPILCARIGMLVALTAVFPADARTAPAANDPIVTTCRGVRLMGWIFCQLDECSADNRAAARNIARMAAQMLGALQVSAHPEDCISALLQDARARPQPEHACEAGTAEPHPRAVDYPQGAPDDRGDVVRHELQRFQDLLENLDIRLVPPILMWHMQALQGLVHDLIGKPNPLGTPAGRHVNSRLLAVQVTASLEAEPSQDVHRRQLLEEIALTAGRMRRALAA